MTLVVGVRCADGVVMGADSAATFGGAGTPTVTQPVRKLDVIDEEVIVVLGVSGFGQFWVREIGVKKLLV